MDPITNPQPVFVIAPDVILKMMEGDPNSLLILDKLIEKKAFATTTLGSFAWAVRNSNPAPQTLDKICNCFVIGEPLKDKKTFYIFKVDLIRIEKGQEVDNGIH